VWNILSFRSVLRSDHQKVLHFVDWHLLHLLAQNSHSLELFGHEIGTDASYRPGYNDWCSSLMTLGAFRLGLNLNLLRASILLVSVDEFVLRSKRLFGGALLQTVMIALNCLIVLPSISLVQGGGVLSNLVHLGLNCSAHCQSFALAVD